ncbi:MAG: pentapeptide repeat-containing protein, partial [Methanotrichaceae archaeon]|nr:pentapeptide repeat-containing protein [Methanotrichaceae archaeon]
YILSALAQVQAAIFGIFFTLSFIITQIQIQNKAASPKSMRGQLRSKMLMLIFGVFTVSITADLTVLQYADDFVQINLFWFLALSVFAVLLLLLYMRNSLMDVFDQSIAEEIRSGQSRMNLAGANLKGEYLRETDLHMKILNGANLQVADLCGANLQYADLRDANLQHASLKGANLQHADLGDANLQYADLKGANLQYADLGDANLQHADLGDANLQYASLKGANLQAAYLRDANLQGTKLDEKTLDSLFKTWDLETAIIDEKLKSDLIKKGEELSADPSIDAAFKTKVAQTLQKLKDKAAINEKSQ